jgi:chromosome segregation ATPase
VEADHAAYNAGDPCLEVMSHYVLHQDRFITEITGQNRAYRNLVFDAETKLGEQEQLTEKLFQEALQERTDFRENTRLHVELEKRSKAEIERLQKELAERDSRIDQLNRKKKELEDTLDRLDESNERRDRRESRHSRRMEAQLKKNADLQNEITQLKKNAALNLRHLKESFKITAFQKDRASRIKTAWHKSDARRVREYRELQRTLPPGHHREPRQETFEVEGTTLDLHACPSSGYAQVERTAEYEEATEYVDRMRRRDTRVAGSSTVVPRLG